TLLFGKIRIGNAFRLRHIRYDLCAFQRRIVGGLGGGGVGILGINEGERANRIGVVLFAGSRGAQSDLLVGVFNRFWKILLLAVVTIVKRVNVIEQRGIGIFGDEIIELFNLRRGFFFQGAR